VRISLGSAAYAAAPRLVGQVIAAHTQARGPANAVGTTVSEAAGVRAPIIYGGTENKRYILETKFSCYACPKMFCPPYRSLQDTEGNETSEAARAVEPLRIKFVIRAYSRFSDISELSSAAFSNA
jgi:hypothetical protein